MYIIYIYTVYTYIYIYTSPFLYIISSHHGVPLLRPQSLTSSGNGSACSRCSGCRCSSADSSAAFVAPRRVTRIPRAAFLGDAGGGTVPYKAIFCGDIHLHSPFIRLIYGRYLHFRILKFPLKQADMVIDDD